MDMAILPRLRIRAILSNTLILVVLCVFIVSPSRLYPCVRIPVEIAPRWWRWLCVFYSTSPLPPSLRLPPLPPSNFVIRCDEPTKHNFGACSVRRPFATVRSALEF